MANPLSNPAGNVAPRWVYQVILVEMTDKTLYGLHATQRHNEIRGIFNGGIWFRFTLTHNWQFWVVMINCGETAYFQTYLLDFDAFLLIFHFVRDFLQCYSWFHPSPDTLGLAVDTRSCCTLQVANKPVRISPEIWLAGFTVFVQQACQISLGYLLYRPHD